MADDDRSLHVAGSGLSRYDLTDPRRPSLVWRRALPNFGVSVSVGEDAVYVVSGGVGVISFPR